MTLSAKAWLGLACVTGAMGLLLFGCAGTLGYWQAWAYLAVYAGSSSLITRHLLRRDPELLARRLRGGPGAEKRKAQKLIMLWTSLAFAASLALPALGRRFVWTHVPWPVAVAGDALTGLFFGFMHKVFKANSFAAATVQVAEGQRVVSVGPYAVVRHPMYAGGLLFFFGTPLALGSYWGLLACAAALPALLWRIRDEEELLTQNLPGYADYCGKVRWRLIPGVF